jgi:hypothetical protein
MKNNLKNNHYYSQLLFRGYKGFDMFRSVVVVVFQSVFHSEKYVNDVFLFFKNYFLD